MMARTKPKAKRVARSKKAAKTAKPAKAARKAPARKPARKAAKRAPKAPKRTLAKPVRKDAAHERHMAEVRARVARQRPGAGPMVPHLHEQQDPSIIQPPPPPPAPTDSLHTNWGDAKQKAVTRNDKPTNWFRQAPKPKAK